MKLIKEIVVKLNLIKILSIPLYVFRVFKIKQNKIVCVNFSGKGYGDSPKYIVSKLLEDKKKYDIVWFVKDLDYSLFPEGIRLVKIYSLRYFYELATAKVWINNSRFPLFVVKRKKQFYIQTWHSPLRLKCIEMDAVENLSEYYKKNMKHDSKNIDLMISGCDFSYGIYSKSFLYNGKIEKCGTPRCDIFFDKTILNNIKTKIQKQYNIDFNKKIILYAPTFRKGKKESEYLLDVEKLSKKLGTKYLFLVKLHPSTNYSILENENIKDFSKYPDIQDLIVICNFLITDYSSCSFDALIANKPCLMYVKDEKDYLKKERKLYFDFKELPFVICKNETELLHNLKEFNYEKYDEKVNMFKKKINLYEKGNASEHIKTIIEEKCFGRK